MLEIDRKQRWHMMLSGICRESIIRKKERLVMTAKHNKTAPRKKKKKKHKSKQILKALREQRDDGSSKPSTTNTTPPTAQKSKKNPLEAAKSYLSVWKQARDEWKFNKKTQTWLIRHMYDSAAVPKPTFEILLEDLQGCSDGLRDNLVTDATCRALRYKDANERNKDSKNETKHAAENERWSQLNDHDKRKEYKRARKILELWKNDKA